MVNRIRKSVTQLLIHLAVNIGLDRQQVFGRELLAALERLVNPLGPVGVAPLQRQRVRRILGGYARVGRGQKPRRRIHRAGHCVERNVPVPIVIRIRNGHALQSPRTHRNPAHGMIRNVPLVVGVDHVQRRKGPDLQSRGKLIPARRYIHRVKRQRIHRRVIDRPRQRYCPSLFLE